MLNELINIANELDKRGLTKEADELDQLAKTAIAPLIGLGWLATYLGGAGASAGAAAVITWAVGAGLVGAGTVALLKNTPEMEDVWGLLNPAPEDIGLEEADGLFENWKNTLAKTDLIDGWGTFPVGNTLGGTWIREFVQKHWDEKRVMTETNFQNSLTKVYGESTMGLTQFGLDNENGWVDTFNYIVAQSKVQTAAAEEGVDFRTGKPFGEEVDKEEGKSLTRIRREEAAGKAKEETVEALDENDRKPRSLYEDAEKTKEDSWESSLEETRSLWEQTMRDSS